jgi:hypothetical protein
MNTTPYSTTISPSNFSVLFLACSAIWSCVADPGRSDGSGDSSTALDGTTDDAGPIPDSTPEPESDSRTSQVREDMGRGEGEEDPNERTPARDEEGCHAIYAQDNLPTFEVTLAPEVWTALKSEWINGQKHEDLGLDPDPYHPVIEFRYENISIDDAEIRLRGNPTWWNADDKMQTRPLLGSRGDRPRCRDLQPPHAA